mgnify:CR=1 FL=1
MITNIEVKPDGVKWGYFKKDMQWVVLDSNNNIIRETVNNDGTKSVYFDGYGYQPSTFKEHLDKNGKADPYAQLDYCKSVKCGGCYYCVWCEHMHLPPNPNKPKAIKKEVKYHRPVELSKWDKLAKATTSKPRSKDPDVHPLFDEIMEVFCGKKI